MIRAETAGTEPRTAKAVAMAFLQAALAGKVVPATQVSRLAREHHLPPKATRSAREALAVQVQRSGFGPGGRWLWSLSGGHIDAQPIPPEEGVGASREASSMSETHQPPAIDGYEVIGLAPDGACAYCGERGVDPVYLMQALFEGVGREPLHEACAGHWFEWYGTRGGQGQD